MQQPVGIAGQFGAQFLGDLGGEGGFHVINADFRPCAQFVKFCAQKFRGQVPGGGGQPFHVRGERGLGDEVLQGEGQGVAGPPPVVAGAGVAGVGDVSRPAVLPQDKSRGGLGVVDGVGGHGDVADGHREAGRHGGVGQDRRILRDDGEVGPDGVVEQMGGNGVEDFGQPVDFDRGPVFADKEFDEVVGQKQDVLDVVQVAVGDEDMLDAGLGGQIEGGGDGTGVKKDGVVDEKRGQVLAGEIGPGTAEYAQVHASLLPCGRATFWDLAV